LTRFYLIMPELRFSLECYSMVAIAIFFDYFVIQGMLYSKNADPGYLIPTEDQEMKKLNKPVTSEEPSEREGGKG